MSNHYSTLGDAVRRTTLPQKLNAAARRLTPADVNALHSVARVTGADPVELIAAEVERRHTVTE
jgi:hypothetical protein